MKITLMLSLNLLLNFCAFSQNIGIGTETPLGKLHIKGNADTSQLVIDASGTQTASHPLILLRNALGQELLRIHTGTLTDLFIGNQAGRVSEAVSFGNHNTFIGFGAGFNNSNGYQNTALGSNTLRGNTTGASNIAIGYRSLEGNTVGFQNTAVGTQALVANTQGNDNTAIGANALLVSTTGAQNTAIGSSALRNNTTGLNNSAMGYQSLAGNTNGYQNTAVGMQALATNTQGNDNTAIGGLALSSNTTGSQNTAVGSTALFSNKTGISNTALGYEALFNTNTGISNTALGVTALVLNSSGSNNTGIGAGSLSSTKTAQYNTALGYNAGANFDNGYNNVFLGANTDVNGAGYYNIIAIGQSTVCTASSQVTIGNGATNSYRAYANWSNISDGRFKKNIQENVPGLDFITKLHPVTYNLNATALDDYLHPASNEDVVTSANRSVSGNKTITANPKNDASKAVYLKALKEKETETITGFVAQDVEATAKQLGFTFSGVEAPKSASDVYGLRYAEFVVPLVKAVQELHAMNTQLNARNTKQQTQIESLEKDKQAQKDTNALLQKQIDELKALIKK